MKLWLDDIREPWKFGYLNWHWVKTAQEAIECFRTGTVEKASLDHDLTEHQTIFGGYVGEIAEDGHMSGYDVVCWLEQNPQFWPPEGVLVHSANPAGAARMRQVINKHYALNFPKGISSL